MDEIHLSLEEADNCEIRRKYAQPIDPSAEHMIKQRIPDCGTISDTVSAEWVSSHALPVNFSPNTINVDPSRFHKDGIEDQRTIQKLNGTPRISVHQEQDVLSKPAGAASDATDNQGPKHTCSICGKMFMTLVTLNNHFKTHSKEKPHICKDCKRSFKQMSNLIQHRRIHTGERPYGCSYCEKSFKQKSQVMQHERLHTGEKPYVCSNCQRAFVQLSQLKYHERTHRSKELVLADDEKYTKGKGTRKRKLPENNANPSVNEVSPVYILTEEDVASGTISAQL